MTEEKISITISCLDHIINEDDEEYCSRVNISVDNKISLDMDTIHDGYEDSALVIFKTDNNYVIKEHRATYGMGLLNIYNNKGELLKEVENSIISYFVESSEFEETYEVGINNNKLFYAYSDDVNFINGIDNYVHIGYIDLNKDLEFIELKRVKGIASLEL